MVGGGAGGANLVVVGAGRVLSGQKLADSFPVCGIDIYPTLDLLGRQCVEAQIINVILDPSLDDILDIVGIATFPNGAQLVVR